MPDNADIVLTPDCGVHCGVKDGMIGHCQDCHDNVPHTDVYDSGTTR